MRARLNGPARNLERQPSRVIVLRGSGQEPGVTSLTAALGRCFPMTRRVHTDRDLLLAMLALKRGLIDHVQLLEAFEAWNAGEDRSMAEILVEQGALEESEVSLVVSQLDDGEDRMRVGDLEDRGTLGDRGSDGRPGAFGDRCVCRNGSGWRAS